MCLQVEEELNFAMPFSVGALLMMNELSLSVRGLSFALFCGFATMCSVEDYLGELVQRNFVDCWGNRKFFIFFFFFLLFLLLLIIIATHMGEPEGNRSQQVSEELAGVFFFLHCFKVLLPNACFLSR